MTTRYEPTKTMEMTRKLVEEDKVLFTLADHRYEYERGDPALFELKEGPAAFCLVGCGGVGSAAGVSLDHGLPANLHG